MANAMTSATVFWPLDCKSSGYCYGWSKPAICVAGVIRADDRANAENALELLRKTSSKLLLQSCGSGLVILGSSRFESSSSGRRREILVPTLTFDNVEEYNITFYHRHLSKSLRFYSLGVLELDSSRSPSAKPQQEYTEESGGISELVVQQLNAAGSIDASMQSHQRLLPLPESYTPTFLPNLFEAILLRFSAAISFASWSLLAFCDTPVFWGTAKSNSFLLKDISSTLQQIDVRAEQASFLVSELDMFRRRKETAVSTYSVRYTGFFNTVWLILNDVTIGYAVGSFLCENHVVLADMLSRAVEDVLINWVQWVLRWLDSWPAGLKLNTELSRFYSHMFIDLIAMWSSILHRVFPYLSNIILVFGFLSSFGGIVGGLTMSISLFSDLLAMFTAHIYVCYVISNTVYARALRTAGSLWNLFRGKRYNVLRNRTDSWEYDIDQLLFGTILFTLLAFLFPTVLAYYSLFAMMRLAIILLQACLETQLAFMNHFPLFAIMLRMKDPWRLPGGVYFALEETPIAELPLLVIENQPLPFSHIFFQYIHLWNKLASYYNPLRLLKCVFAGEFLAPISRQEIRYSRMRNGIKSGGEGSDPQI